MRAHEHPSLNHRMEAVGGLLEAECREVIQDFFRSRRERSRVAERPAAPRPEPVRRRRSAAPSEVIKRRAAASERPEGSRREAATASAQRGGPRRGFAPSEVINGEVPKWS